MKKVNCRVNKINIRDCEVYLANSFWDKLFGLMFKGYEKSYGLILMNSPSIHTCFMKYPLDVYFVDSNFKVIKQIKKLKPWRVTGLYFKSQYVLELPSEKTSVNISEGDTLEFINV